MSKKKKETKKISFRRLAIPDFESIKKIVLPVQSSLYTRVA